MITLVRNMRDLERQIERPEVLQEQLAALTLDDCVALERQLGVFGPFSTRKFLQSAPERVLRNLDLSRRWPWKAIKGGRQGVESMDVNDLNPSNFGSVTASATETNLWTPAIWTPIPANDMRAGKIYRVTFAGIFTSTATQGVLTWTWRGGQSSTPASNVSFGASNAVAPPASLTNAPFLGMGFMGVRSLGLAAGGATCVGHCFIHVQGAAASTAIDYLAGGTVPTTIDNTAASGLICSLTISVASQSYTCQYAFIQSLN
jgi:hypothetical protein